MVNKELPTEQIDLKISDEMIWHDTKRECWKEHFTDLYGNESDMLKCGSKTNAINVTVQEKHKKWTNK